MSPRTSSKPAPTEYTYRWGSDWAAVIDGFSTPDGAGVLAMPGKEFSTTAPVHVADAIPVNDAAKAAADAKAAEEPAAADLSGEQASESDAGADAPPSGDGAEPPSGEEATA